MRCTPGYSAAAPRTRSRTSSRARRSCIDTTCTISYARARSSGRRSRRRRRRRCREVALARCGSSSENRAIARRCTSGARLRRGDARDARVGDEPCDQAVRVERAPIRARVRRRRHSCARSRIFVLRARAPREQEDRQQRDHASQARTPTRVSRHGGRRRVWMRSGGTIASRAGVYAAWAESKQLYPSLSTCPLEYSRKYLYESTKVLSYFRVLCRSESVFSDYFSYKNFSYDFLTISHTKISHTIF